MLMLIIHFQLYISLNVNIFKEEFKEQLNYKYYHLQEVCCVIEFINLFY